MMDGAKRPAADEWLEPRPAESPLRRYVQLIVDRRWIVALAMGATLAAAVLYVATAPRVYEAEADLLVSPVTDPNLSGLGLLNRSGDPTRTVQTVTRLVGTEAIARRAKLLTRDPDSPQALLQRMQAEPVAGSDIVAITARGPTPAQAAALANGFARAVIDDRHERLQAQLARTVPRLQALVGRERRSERSDTLLAELGAQQALLGADDPSVQLANRADPPQAPVSPRKALSIAAALVVGLLLGVGAALLADVLDPRLRRESQLQALFDLPVLARVPRLRTRRRGPLAPSVETARALPAYRRLRYALDAAGGNGGPEPASIVFMGAGRGDGCSTTALHYASLLAAEDEDVVLLDADLRQPSIGPAVGAGPSPHLADVLERGAWLETALVLAQAGGATFRVLAPDGSAGAPTGRNGMLLPLGKRLLVEPRHRLGRMVIDAPPLTEDIDALPLARVGDRLAIVARLGSTRLSALRELERSSTATDCVQMGSSWSAPARRQGRRPRATRAPSSRSPCPTKASARRAFP